MAFGHGGSSASGHKWVALHEAARMVATVAGIDPEPAQREIRDFPTRIRKAASWRRDLAERGIEDIAAAVEPGLAALCSAEARGADPRPAAQALWGEFVEARSAVLALLPPAGPQGPLLGG